MCWNPREPRPHPTYLLASVANFFACFNFFNFHPVSTKFPMNIEHIILTNRMFFVFGIANFLAGKLCHKLGVKKLKINYR